MNSEVKNIEILNNFPVGKLSTGGCYEYTLNLQDNTKLIDLKSLKYNFKYNKYFQSIEVFVNDILVHSYIYPDAIGNRSPYYFVKDEDLLVSGNDILCIKFTRNSKDCDISDFKLFVNVISSKSESSNVNNVRIKSMICPYVRRDGYMIVGFDPIAGNEGNVKSRKVVFAGFEVSNGIITDDVSFKIMNQMGDVICDNMKLGEVVEIDAKYQRLYFKLNNEDMDNIINVFFNEYY